MKSARELRVVGPQLRGGNKVATAREAAASTSDVLRQSACSGCAGEYEDPERTAASAEDEESVGEVEDEQQYEEPE